MQLIYWGEVFLPSGGGGRGGKVGKEFKGICRMASPFHNGNKNISVMAQGHL